MVPAVWEMQTAEKSRKSRFSCGLTHPAEGEEKSPQKAG